MGLLSLRASTVSIKNIGEIYCRFLRVCLKTRPLNDKNIKKLQHKYRITQKLIYQFKLPEMTQAPALPISEPLASLLTAIGVCAKSPDRYQTGEELIGALHVLARTPSDWQSALPILEEAQISYQSQLRHSHRHQQTLAAINRAHAIALQASTAHKGR